jgi:hypothetical protein
MLILRALVIGACLLLMPGGFVAQEGAKPRLWAPSYYIAIHARLQTDTDVWVFGASNLPSGSIITFRVYDMSGKPVSQDAMATVGDDGLFRVDLRPKKGSIFRPRMECDAVFETLYPKQPAEVLKMVGKHGENLGTTGDNPQVQDNSRIKLLSAEVVVTQ